VSTSAVLAHESWFGADPDRFPLQWERLTDLPVVVAVVTALPVLGYVEFFGHLPLYAVLLVVVVEAQAERVREAEQEQAAGRPHREVPPVLRGVVEPTRRRRPSRRT
jgi:hypothetical protein